MRIDFTREEIEVANYLYENYYAGSVRDAFCIVESISDDWFNKILIERATINRTVQKTKGNTIQISPDRTGDTEGNTRRRKDLARVLGILAKKHKLGFNKDLRGTYKEEDQESPSREASVQISPAKGSRFDSSTRLTRLARALRKRYGQDSVITTDTSGQAKLHYKNPKDTHSIGTAKHGVNPEPEKGETRTIKTRNRPERAFHFA